MSGLVMKEVRAFCGRGGVTYEKMHSNTSY